MTGLDRTQTPKTRQMPPNKTALVAALDIGTQQDRLPHRAVEAVPAERCAARPDPCG